jgi:hypothetical protein
MQTHRIVIALNLSQKPPIAVQTRRSSQTAGWGLDIKKNFRPPPWVKFVLDIPFHRTLSRSGGESGSLEKVAWGGGGGIQATSPYYLIKWSKAIKGCQFIQRKFRDHGENSSG